MGSAQARQGGCATGKVAQYRKLQAGQDYLCKYPTFWDNHQVEHGFLLSNGEFAGCGWAADYLTKEQLEFLGCDKHETLDSEMWEALKDANLI